MYFAKKYLYFANQYHVSAPLVSLLCRRCAVWDAALSSLYMALLVMDRISFC